MPPPRFSPSASPFSPASANGPSGRTVRPSPGLVRSGIFAGLPKRPQPEPRRYLSFTQVAQLANAAAFAASIGYPLNAQITLAWERIPGFSAYDLPQLQGALMLRLAQWLKRRGVTLRCVWVRERVSGRGLHTHLMLSLPLTLKDEAQAFLTASGGFVDTPRSKGVWIECGACTAAAWAGSLRYFAKGLDHRDFVYGSCGSTENLGVLLGVDHRGSQGVIPCKRSGTSENLGPKARSRAGWREVRDPLGLSFILNPERLANE